MYKQDIKEKVKERYGKIALLGNVDSCCMSGEDPKGKSVEKVREIRDEIEQRIRELSIKLPKDVYQ